MKKWVNQAIDQWSKKPVRSLNRSILVMCSITLVVSVFLISASMTLPIPVDVGGHHRHHPLGQLIVEIKANRFSPLHAK